jgi:hypothetical protein
METLALELIKILNFPVGKGYQIHNTGRLFLIFLYDIDFTSLSYSTIFVHMYLILKISPYIIATFATPVHITFV